MMMNNKIVVQESWNGEATVECAVVVNYLFNKQLICLSFRISLL